jgi:cytochrome b6-f complex iron-sulfur subunit
MVFLSIASVKKMKETKNISPLLPERRSFLSKIWLALGVVALAEFVFGGASFFISARKNEGHDVLVKIIEAGNISDFLPGTVTFIHAGNCYLSCLQDGGILAISRKCTHLGCAVPWIAARNQFECPCHASVFDNTGNVIKSPAPRALDLYPVNFEQTMIKNDISRPVKRASFPADQVSYPQELG